MKAIIRFFKWVESMAMAMAVASLFLMMAGISIDAAGRYFLGLPLEGAFEFTELYFMIIVVFMALPDSYSSGTQIQLDIANKYLDILPGRLLERAGLLIAASVLGLMSWYSIDTAIEKFADSETAFGSIQFRLDWSYVWVPIGTSLLTLRLLLRVLFLEPVDGSQDG